MTESYSTLSRYIILALLVVTLFGLVGHFALASPCGLTIDIVGAACPDSTQETTLIANPLSFCVFHLGFLAPVAFGFTPLILLTFGGIFISVSYPLDHSFSILRPPIF